MPRRGFELSDPMRIAIEFPDTQIFSLVRSRVSQDPEIGPLLRHLG